MRKDRSIPMVINWKIKCVCKLLDYDRDPTGYHGSGTLSFCSVCTVIRDITHWAHTKASKMLVGKVRVVSRSEVIHTKGSLLRMMKLVLLRKLLRLLYLRSNRGRDLLWLLMSLRLGEDRFFLRQCR